MAVHLQAAFYVQHSSIMRSCMAGSHLSSCQKWGACSCRKGFSAAVASVLALPAAGSPPPSASACWQEGLHEDISALKPNGQYT